MLGATSTKILENQHKNPGKSSISRRRQHRNPGNMSIFRCRQHKIMENLAFFGCRQHRNPGKLSIFGQNVGKSSTFRAYSTGHRRCSPQFRQVRNCSGINYCIDSQDKIPQELILTIWALQTYHETADVLKGLQPRNN